MDINSFKSGLLRSPVDERNYKLSYICNTEGITIPNEFCLIDKSKIEIKNQGSIGCCVGESLAYHNFVTEYIRNNGNAKEFSVGWVYGNRLAVDNQNSGMIPQEALKRYMEDGIVYQEDFPVLVEMPDIETKVLAVKDSLLPKAKLHKIKAYAELNTIEEMKIALIQLKTPLFVGIPICQSFFSGQHEGIISNPDFNKEQPLGYHGIIIIGWSLINGNYYWINPNSWGSENGDKGFNYLPIDFPFCEVYGITDDELINPTPEIKTYWRVQIYAFKNRDNANSAMDKLRTQGIDCCLVFQDGYLKIQCGCFASIENRDNMVNKLMKLGYKPYIITIQK